MVTREAEVQKAREWRHERCYAIEEVDEMLAAYAAHSLGVELG